MTMMALAIDPADDPPVNTNLSVSALGNSLRSYLDDASARVVPGIRHVWRRPIRHHQLRIGTRCERGPGQRGMPPEGMLYGESIGSILMACCRCKPPVTTIRISSARRPR